MSARRIAYYDFNYIQNAVYRISLGEIPFRDFDLVLPAVPYILVYLVHLLINVPINISVYFATCILIVITTHALAGIITKLNAGGSVSLNRAHMNGVLAFSSLFGVVSIYPNFVYDSVATAFALASINQFLSYLQNSDRKNLYYAGSYLALSIFSKYNMGGFLAVGMLLTLLLLTFRQTTKNFRNLLVSGLMLLLPTLLLGGIFLLTGPSAVYEQTVVAASKFKNLDEVGQFAQYNYPALIVLVVLISVNSFTKKWSKAIILMTEVFVFSGSLVVALQQLLTPAKFKTETLQIFPSASFIFPILMLLALSRLVSEWQKLQINSIFLLISLPLYFFGTFLSQGWNGSSYSLWPMLGILYLTVFYCENEHELKVRNLLRILSIGLITLGLGSSNLNGERLGFVENNGKRSQINYNFNVIGSAMSKNDLMQMKEIEEQVTLGMHFGPTIVLPAEDSIESFGSLQTPWGRCLQYTAICPSFSQIAFRNEFKSNPPTVVIIKNKPQIIFEIEPITREVEKLASRCFTSKYSNSTYQLFVSNESTQSCLVKLTDN
jgi:hypothetical protein